MTFPIDVQTSTQIKISVQNEAKPNDARSFTVAAGIALPPEIFDLEPRGRNHPAARGAQLPIIHGLQPGWTLTSLEDLTAA